MDFKQRHNLRRVLSVILGIVFIISSLYVPVFSTSVDNTSGVNNTSKPEINALPYLGGAADNKIIVKYKDKKKSSYVKRSISKKLNNIKINVEKKLKEIEVIGVSDKAEFAFVMQEFKNNPNVEYVQPDYKLKAYDYDFPTDIWFKEQWGLYNDGQTIGGQSGIPGMDANIFPAWNYTTGNENVIVGVLDSGIDINHPELKGGIYENKGEIPNNGKDDDNNGYIDDVNGWDFLNTDNTVFDNADEDFHATHVSGIIAAEHNGQGVCGMAPGVRILPLKFLNDYGGYTSDAIEAIQYAEKMGVKVINCSWGDTNYNYALEQAMKNSGILFVCASGNDAVNVDITPCYPACFDIPNIITVAAINNRGERSGFSNYGTKVDIAAPGTYIKSTIPGDDYGYANGTSMAAPFITATAALIWSVNNTYGVQKVKDKIIGSAKGDGTALGIAVTGGIVNAGLAVKSTWEEKTDTPTPTVEPTPTPKIYHGDTDTDTDTGTEQPELPEYEAYPPTGSTATPTPSPIVTTPPATTEAPSGKCIKGQVFIPGDIPAQDDIKMQVYLENEKEKIYTTYVDINKGEPSKEFTLYTLDASSEDELQIGYYIYDGGQSYCKNGYYTSYGVTFDEGFADNLSTTDNINDIKLDLLTKRKISGKVSLPDDMEAPEGGIEIKVKVGSKASPQYTEYIKIPEGQKSAPYEICAFENNSRDMYYVGYELKYSFDYMPGGYYNQPGTKPNFEDAKSVDIDTKDAPNIDLTLIKSEIVSGTVSLPDGEVAPEGGVQVYVYAKAIDGSTSYYDINTIEEGKKSANYWIAVPYENSSYYIYYNTIQKGYVRVGYYNSGATTYNSDKASPVSIPLKVENVNLTLIAGGTIFGRVYMPYGMSAPVGGVGVVVAAVSENEDESDIDVLIFESVMIEENTLYADYTITVPERKSEVYSIFAVNVYKGFVEAVYGTGNNDNSVYIDNVGLYPVTLDSGLNHDFNLVEGSEVSGEISLPDAAPQGGLTLKVRSVTEDRIGSIYDTLIIPQGLKKVNYSLTLPRNKSFYMKYELAVPNGKYYKDGYYAGNKTVSDIQYVKIMRLDSNNLDNINMQVIKKETTTPTDNPVVIPPVVYIPVNGVIPGAGEASPTPTATVTPTPTQSPVSSSTPVPSSSQPSVDPGKIPGDISKHWAREDIIKLIGRDFVSGYQDGTIKPDSDITRAEITKLIVKMLGLQPSQNTSLTFSDSQRIPDWARGYIQVVSEKGIVKGYDDKSFRPDNKLSRMEMAVIILRALGYNDPPKAQLGFTDNKQIPEWAAGYVAKAVELGILKGYSDGSFKPYKNITRAEAFAVILRSMELKK